MENVKQSCNEGFINDVDVWLIDKTQASDPSKSEFQWMRTVKSLHPGSLNIESDYQQPFQTNAYFYCNVWLSKYYSTFLSNCCCIVFSFVYLAALVWVTCFVLLIEFSNVLNPCQPLSWDSTCYSLLEGVTCYLLRQYFDFSFILRV